MLAFASACLAGALRCRSQAGGTRSFGLRCGFSVRKFDGTFTFGEIFFRRIRKFGSGRGVLRTRVGRQLLVGHHRGSSLAGTSVGFVALHPNDTRDHDHKQEQKTEQCGPLPIGYNRVIDRDIETIRDVVNRFCARRSRGKRQRFAVLMVRNGTLVPRRIHHRGFCPGWIRVAGGGATPREAEPRSRHRHRRHLKRWLGLDSVSSGPIRPRNLRARP